MGNERENAGYGGNGRTAMEAYMVADAAMKKIEEHTKDCKEFRRDLRESQERAAQDRQRMHDANQKSLALAKSSILVEVSHVAGRVDRLYNRAWAVAFTIMGIEGAALIYFVKQFMERAQQ